MPVFLPIICPRGNAAFHCVSFSARDDTLGSNGAYTGPNRPIMTYKQARVELCQPQIKLCWMACSLILTFKLIMLLETLLMKHTIKIESRPHFVF